MLNYAHKLACAYVDAKMKAMGSTFSLASPEFVFYFQTFRRYLKKSQGEDTEIIRILGSPGIEAIKFYSHFCGSLLRKLKKALPAAVKRTTATSEIGKTLRTLFVYPTLRCYRGGKREWHEKATQELLGEREALPMIEQVMVRNTLLWPYVAYRLFSHGRRRRTCDTLDCCCHKIYAMLAKELPLVGPTSICKFLWQDLDNEVHLNVVETCLGRLEALCGGDQKHVEALKVLYELKHKRALAKYPDPELRAAVHLGPAQANPIVYGLISSKYGYMLCWMCRRRMPQEQCQKVSARYNLPLGLASVEPVRPSRDHFAPPTDRVWVRNPKIAPEDVKPAAQTLKSAATKKPRRAKAKRVTTGKKRTQKPVTVTAKRKLKPKYVPCSAVTCPIIELCKTFMTSLSPSFEVQGIVLSMTDQSRKLLTQQLFYYLSKYQLMTPTIFLPLWTQQQSKEILLVRPTEQTAIYEFVAGTCDPKIVLGILVHALQSQDRAYLKAVLSCCVRFAVVTRNAKVWRRQVILE